MASNATNAFFCRRRHQVRRSLRAICSALCLSIAINGPSLMASDLWSVQPLEKPAVPDSGNYANPVDRFVANQLNHHGLEMSPPADRRTLIRRLYFDLIGLPPTPGQIEAFVQSPSEDAYEQLVDELLQSPHYGERWARHWLDVVHFGETHGYDKDKPRNNAWPYRDYVIRAFNDDKPWSRFVEEQIAGDVLYPHTRDGNEALGFIAAGPWDFIGHAEVPETKIDGQIARHLDRDDMVANTMQSFNSLTVQCAQCHDHKFDPISQQDYYSLQAVFAALDRADRDYDYDPGVSKRRSVLNNERSLLSAERNGINQAIRDRAGEELIRFEDEIKAAEKKVKNGDAFGYHSQIESEQESIKWVQVDFGDLRVVSEITLHPASDNFNGIGDGFGFPVRFRVELADDAAFTKNVCLVADHSDVDFENPGINPVAFAVNEHPARFVRVTATRLAPRKNDFIFALAELRAIDSSGRNIAPGRPVMALDSIEAPVRWSKANLTDDWFPGMAKSDSNKIQSLEGRRDKLLADNTGQHEQDRLGEIHHRLIVINKLLSSLPKPHRVYAGTVHSGSGSFLGTGHNGGAPRPVHLLSRGDVTKPRELVSPGALEVLSNESLEFELPDEHDEGDRRAALAKWISSPHNPLTWRSVVNRIWQQHFGVGLVETPNDFGAYGGAPSHPELLDWLACEFRDNGQSLKQLHRVIVTSATYRQSSSTVNGNATAIDANNRLLWKMNRRKLDAESVRDSMLFVSGRLNPEMGGPSFRDFVVEKPEHSPHYQYHLYDPEDESTHRRTIYRFLVRSQPQPLMSVLDCADPSMQVARRNESITPLQSLAMLNNSLVITMSKYFADRLGGLNLPLDEQVEEAVYSALGRPPTDSEKGTFLSFVEDHGIENLCRVLFNLNEFTFVD